MSRTSIITIAIIIIIVIIGAGYYLATRNNTNSPTTSLYTTPTPTSTSNVTPSPTQSATAPTNSSTNSSTVSISINGQNDSFSPNTITVSKGDTVKVTFKSIDTTHTFTLPDFNVDTGSVSAGQSKTVQFIADKTGTFQFYCQFHKAMGMTGTLTVK